MLVALLLMSGRPSRAADPRLDSARAHSQEGDSYYKLEKYANAITEYEQAYLAKPDPSFLYNIAQCHRLMGQGAEAIKFYRRFLKDAPTAPNRAVAEKHIRDLEDASRGTQPPSPTTPAPPRARRRPQRRPPPVIAADGAAARAVAAPPPDAGLSAPALCRRTVTAHLHPLQRRCRRRQPSKPAPPPHNPSRIRFILDGGSGRAWGPWWWVE